MCHHSIKRTDGRGMEELLKYVPDRVLFFVSSQVWFIEPWGKKKSNQFKSGIISSVLVATEMRCRLLFSHVGFLLSRTSRVRVSIVLPLPPLPSCRREPVKMAFQSLRSQCTLCEQRRTTLMKCDVCMYVCRCGIKLGDWPW